MIDSSKQRDVVVRRDPPRSGSENMAIDESALVNAKPGDPVLIRLYQWQEPTLSLGHFQDWAQWEQDPRTCNLQDVRAIPWVRRKTGGGAILHDREWTYSLVIPEDTHRPGKGHSERLYRAVHEAVRDGLIAAGWNAQFSENCTCSTANRADPEPFLCFQRRSPVDIVVGNHKVLGSAQRRHRAGLLQHGSLLLHSSGLVPDLLGLEQLPRASGEALDWPTWIAGCIRTGIRHAIGVDCEDERLKNRPRSDTVE